MWKVDSLKMWGCRLHLVVLTIRTNNSYDIEMRVWFLQPTRPILAQENYFALVSPRVFLEKVDKQNCKLLVALDKWILRRIFGLQEEDGRFRDLPNEKICKQCRKRLVPNEIRLYRLLGVGYLIRSGVDAADLRPRAGIRNIGYHIATYLRILCLTHTQLKRSTLHRVPSQ